MKKVLWLIVGIGIGILAAHQVNQTAQGKKFFSNFDKKTKEFTDSFLDGYRERESELRDAVSDVGDRMKKAAKK